MSILQIIYQKIITLFVHKIQIKKQILNTTEIIEFNDLFEYCKMNYLFIVKKMYTIFGFLGT